jgi:hypothetical protein
MKEPIEYRIADYFIAAMVNGDTSGLEDEEEGLLDGFLQSIGVGTWDYGSEADFAQCDVTGLWGNCVEAKFYEDIKI